MASNKDLYPYFNKIHRTLGDVLTQVKAAVDQLRQIKEAVVEGFESLQQAVDDSIRANAELQYIEHVVDLQAIEPQIDAEKERIDQEEAELDRRLERIQQRFERRHDELDEKAAKRVRDLGSHIFEIDEEEFAEGVESPFTEHVTDTWSRFRTHNLAIVDYRSDRVETTSNEVAEEIEQFVEQQQELATTIDAHRTDLEVPGDDVQRIQVPYYVVSVDTDGGRTRHLVPPGEVLKDGGVIELSITPKPGFDDLVSDAGSVDEQVATIGPRQLNDLGAEFRTDAPPFLSYGSVVEEAAGGGVPVSVEGGGN